MKKYIFLILFILCAVGLTYADRDVPTIHAYNSSQLIKLGDGKVYSVSFKATGATSYYVITDSTTSINTYANTKAEGAEATSGNGQFQNFSNKPLEFSNGIYLTISNGIATISWE